MKGRVTRIDRVRIKPRGKKGHFQADFSVGGQHRRMSLKTANFQLARERARKLNAQLALGKFDVVEKKWTMADSVAAYIEHCVSVGKAIGTIAVYRTVLEPFWNWCHGRALHRMAQLTPTEFENYQREFRLTHDLVTVHHHATVIKQWVKWAAARGHLADHVLKLSSLKKPPRKRRFVPSLTEVWQILHAASPAQRILFAMLAMTGMRSGELRNLRAEDIDWKANWIAIVSRPGLETKTRSSRKVPLHPVLRGLLEGRSLPKTGLAFCAPPSRRYPQGDHHLNTGVLNQQLRSITRSLGFSTGRKDCGMTLHTFRRFFETHTVNSGIPQKCIDAWLGHTSDRSMGTVYYSLTDPQSQSFMAQLDFRDPAGGVAPNA